MPISRRRRGDRVGDHAVQSRHAEQQRHRAGDRQHDQGERGAGHRFAVQLVQRPHLRQRQAGVDGPHGRADLIDQRRAPGAIAAQGEADPSRLVAGHALQLLGRQRRPVDRRRRRAIDAVVVDVAGHADHFPPRRVRHVVLAKPPPQRRRRRSPQLAGQVLRDDGDLAPVVEIGPGEVAAGDERRPLRAEQPRRHDLDLPVGRRPAVVGHALDRDRGAAAVAAERQPGGKRHRCHAWERGEPVHDVVLHPRHALRLGDRRRRDRQAERLHARRVR